MSELPRRCPRKEQNPSFVELVSPLVVNWNRTKSDIYIAHHIRPCIVRLLDGSSERSESAAPSQVGNFVPSDSVAPRTFAYHSDADQTILRSTLHDRNDRRRDYVPLRMLKTARLHIIRRGQCQPSLPKNALECLTSSSTTAMSVRCFGADLFPQSFNIVQEHLKRRGR